MVLSCVGITSCTAELDLPEGHTTFTESPDTEKYRPLSFCLLFLSLQPTTCAALPQPSAQRKDPS